MKDTKGLLTKMARLLWYRFTQQLLFVLLLTGFFIWGLLHLGGFSWSWDEGVLLLTGRMVARGYPLYTEIWYNYPPLHPFLLAVAFRLLGEAVAVGRGIALAFSVVGLIGVAWVAGRASRSGSAALAAAILLLLSPPFLANSRVALADQPAASLSAVATAMALCYLHQGRGCWLAAAGLSLGLSVLFKPTAAFTVGSVLLAIWLRDRADLEGQRTIGRMIGHTALLFVGMVCALAIGLLPVNVGCFWQQMMDTYWASRGAHVLDLGQNLHRVWAYLTWTEYGPPRFGFLALAAFGALGLFRRRAQPTGWVLLAWLGLGWGALLSHAPLYNHLLISLLLPLAAVGGCGLGWLAELIRDWPRAVRLHRSLAIVGLVAVTLYVIGLPSLWAADRALAYPPDDDEDRDALVAARELRAIVPPGEFIVTDSLMLAFHSERDVPPELVNTSSMRIRTGQLTAEQLIAWTQAYRPAAIIFWDDRLESLPAYVDWVRAHYRLARWFGKERRVYFPYSPPTYTQLAHFRDEIALLGYSLTPLSLQPGQSLQVALHWRAEATPTEDYALRLELLDANQRLRDAIRVPVTEGKMSPTHWRKGDNVVGTYTLPVESDTPPGTYTVCLSLLARKTRLEVFGDGQLIPDGIVRLSQPLQVVRSVR